MNINPISVKQRYKSSARIDSNKDDYASRIDNFILHGTAVNVLDTISRDYMGSEQRAYTLTGPYGSGKSTVALFLSSLLSRNKKERAYATKKLDKAQGALDDFPTRLNNKHGWTVVKHVCGLESPANSILASILSAFDTGYDVETIKAYDDERCLEEIKHALSGSEKKSDGTLLLLDEMGKALDYQSRANKDLHLFQALADIAQQAERPVMLIGFLHQSFSDYAKNKDVKAQKEWAKVQGRYRDLSFNPSIEESLILVGDSITKSDEVSKRLGAKHECLIDSITQSFTNQNQNKPVLNTALPLDPLVSLLLGPISRRRFSQNERSLFGFLASHEKLGFREFLAENYTNESSTLELYQPELLWDYLHHNLHHLIVTSADSKAWLEACDAIYRASQKGTDLHISITKIIALLTVFGFQHHLHANKQFIKNYFLTRDIKKDDIENAIADLEKWTVVIYRQKHDALFVFQGSDIDIQNMILERIESISHGVDWTSACSSSQSILATAHYHRTGTMRWAQTHLINKVAGDLENELTAEPTTGESFLRFLLPSNAQTEKELFALSKKSPYIIVGKIRSLDRLKAAAIELIALTQISREEKKITHDLIAKNELDNRIKAANLNIEEELTKAYSVAHWVHKKHDLGTQPLSIIASKIADDIFHASPEVINELVNRSKPSGSANSAIRKLMNAMLEHGDEKDLKFPPDTFPPEKGLYLSCLKSKGWHCKTEEGFVFPGVWSQTAIENNHKMHALWEDGVNFIKTSNEMLTLDALYNRWMRPPFGLTSGLCRIYGLALLKSLEGQVAFYDLDSSKQFIFIPELDEELVTKIYKHPSEAGVRYFEISGIQTHLLDTLAKATLSKSSSDDTILGIAKHIVRIIHKLPPWVKKTSGESFAQADESNGLTNEARAFRNKVLSANDPYKLILEDLPSVFNLDLNDKDIDKKLGTKLKTAISDLSAQHDILLSGFKQIIKTGLSAEFDDDLLARCTQVASVAQRPNVKELASRLVKYINGKASFEKIINLTTGTPEKNWTDKHLRNGLDELQILCIQFRRIESFNTINDKGATQPIALLTNDQSGNFKEYSGFMKYDLESDSEVRKAISKVQESLSGMSKEKQLATLSNLISSVMEPAND